MLSALSDRSRWPWGPPLAVAWRGKTYAYAKAFAAGGVERDGTGAYARGFAAGGVEPGGADVEHG